MNGSDTLYTALLNDSGVTSLVSTYEGNPCIAYGSKDPSKWGPELTTISFYDPVGVDNTLDWLPVEYAVNCRAQTESAARTLAKAVVDAVNRKPVTGGGRYYCVTLFMIQPQNETDNYNLPVSVRIRSIKELN